MSAADLAMLRERQHGVARRPGASEAAAVGKGYVRRQSGLVREVKQVRPCAGQAQRGDLIAMSPCCSRHSSQSCACFTAPVGGTLCIGSGQLANYHC
jgi:hypothetical protein